MEIFIYAYWGLMGAALSLAWLSLVATIVVFSSAGYNGLSALIPGYSYYIRFRIANKTELFIPSLVLSLVLMWALNAEHMLVAAVCELILLPINYVVMLGMARVFGRGRMFALGMVFLEPIFMLFLAAGNRSVERAQR